MQIIEELETCRRSVYCGSFIRLGYDGGLDSNIAIRTLVQEDGCLYLWSGGGLVADSSSDANTGSCSTRQRPSFGCLRRAVWIVKLGGSLMRSPALAAWLQALRAGGGRIIVVPGGGEYADRVRGAQAREGYSDSAAHRMALRAMHRYGAMLARRCPGLQQAATRNGLRRALHHRRTPLWSPEQMASAWTELPRDRGTTSDGLAPRLAGLNARGLPDTRQARQAAAYAATRPGGPTLPDPVGHADITAHPFTGWAPAAMPLLRRALGAGRPCRPDAACSPDETCRRADPITPLHYTMTHASTGLQPRSAPRAPDPALLETVANPAPERDYLLHITDPRVHLPVSLHRPAGLHRTATGIHPGKPLRGTEVPETLHLVLPQPGRIPRGRDQPHPGRTWSARSPHASCGSPPASTCAAASTPPSPPNTACPGWQPATPAAVPAPTAES